MLCVFLFQIPYLILIMFPKFVGSLLPLCIGCSIFLVFVLLVTNSRVDTVEKAEKGARISVAHKSDVPKTSSQSDSDSFLEILKCNDAHPQKSIEQRSGYIVFRNYVRADRQFRCHESVTLTAPGDYRFLDNILPLVDRWRGPISVALYSPGYDFFNTLKSIAYLRSCKSRLIKAFVTFHLFFDEEHMPVPHDRRPLMDIYDDSFNCSQKPPYETLKDEDMYKVRNSLTYPINVARNVAKLAAQTYFVFPSDIELYPTRYFIEKFLSFIRKHHKIVLKKNARNVYVLALFEVLSDQQIPETKTELQQMLRNKTAFLFHKAVCEPCHRVPRGNEWVEEKEGGELDVFTVGKRQGKQTVWEPFFVCTQKEPLWDERLNWEGQGNKMCQVYHLCMLDYDFLVLDNAFLVHKPGVKKTKVQNLKHKDEQKKNNQILRTIQSELTNIYGKNDKCRIHYV